MPERLEFCRMKSSGKHIDRASFSEAKNGDTIVPSLPRYNSLQHRIRAGQSKLDTVCKRTVDVFIVKNERIGSSSAELEMFVQRISSLQSNAVRILHDSREAFFPCDFRCFRCRNIAQL